MRSRGFPLMRLGWLELRRVGYSVQAREKVVQPGRRRARLLVARVCCRRRLRLDWGELVHPGVG